MAESVEELKSLLMRMKTENEKNGLKLNIQKTIKKHSNIQKTTTQKLNIQKTKIMASGPITSWQIEGEKVEAVTIFFSWAPKSLQTVTAAMKWKDACSLEGKL